MAANKDQWSLETLKLSTFEYEWTADEGYKLANELHLGDWKNLWEGTAAPISHTQALTSDLWAPTWTIAGKFTAESLPGRELRRALPGVFAFTGCDIKSERKTTLFNFGKDIAFDVVSKAERQTGFRALAPKRQWLCSRLGRRRAQLPDAL